jgi:hypothetical protein
MATERINGGLSHPLPHDVECAIVELHQNRAKQLQTFLADECRIQVPSQWQRILNRSSPTQPFTVPEQQCSTSGGMALSSCPTWNWDVGDQRLMELLGRDRLEEPVVELIEENFLGFNLVRHRDCFVAFRMSAGPLDPDQLTAQWWNAQVPAGNAVSGDDLMIVKAQILNLQMTHWQSRCMMLEHVVQRNESQQVAASKLLLNECADLVASLERRYQSKIAALELMLPVLESCERRIAAIESKWWRRAISKGVTFARSVYARIRRFASRAAILWGQTVKHG